MITLTVRHKKTDPLGRVWDGVAAGWARVTSGAMWRDNEARYGFEHNGRRRIGWVRAVEVTHGASGWHVHVHAILFLPALLTLAELRLLSESMFARWRSGVTATGLAAPIAKRGGLDCRFIDSVQAVALYLSKATYPADVSKASRQAVAEAQADKAGWEIAGGAMKEGRRGNRAPFQILRDFVATGDLDDLDLWHEWERGSRGRRQLTWARWFKNWLEVEEISDEEIAEEELDGEILGRIQSWEWTMLRPHKARLLHLAETLPLELLRATPIGAWLTLESPPD